MDPAVELGSAPTALGENRRQRHKFGQRAASERPIALPRAGGRARARGARAGMAARAMRHTAAWRRRPPRWAAVLLLLLSHLGCTVAQPAETVCGHPATVQQFAYQDGYQLTEFVLVKTIAVGVGSSIAPPTLCARFIRSPPRRPQTAHRGPHASLLPLLRRNLGAPKCRLGNCPVHLTGLNLNQLLGDAPLSSALCYYGPSVACAPIFQAPTPAPPRRDLPPCRPCDPRFPAPRAGIVRRTRVRRES